MRILSLDPSPLHVWHYLHAAPRGGSQTGRLELLRGTAEGLPEELDGLLALSDLQGMAPHALRDGAAALLGEVLADELAMMGEAGDLPHPGRVGVLLAGDLFSSDTADVRGASGDVRGVWEAFAAQFRWVAGVAGNHDTFGTPRERERLLQRASVHLLDGEVREVDGLRLGGVGLISGNPEKRGRRTEEAQLGLLRTVLRASPRLLVLHEGPDAPGDGRRGSAALRAALEAQDGLLVVCGHSHWEAPLAALAPGVQVLNVDARAVLLQRAPR
jgi:predicted phosphodiesterase